MAKYIAVIIGGGIGSLMRYSTVGFVQSRVDAIFPVGTMFVNLVGCFFIGFLWTVFELTTVRPETRVFFITGILGGFTTFSSFGMETFNLFRDGEYLRAFANFAISNIAGFFCVVAGVFASRAFISLFR
jgi:CrcB protein